MFSARTLTNRNTAARWRCCSRCRLPNAKSFWCRVSLRQNRRIGWRKASARWLREELQTASIATAVPSLPPDDAIPDSALNFLSTLWRGWFPYTKVLLVMASLTTKFNELSLVLVNGFASAAVVCLLCKHRKERTHEQIDRNHPG